MSIIKIIDHILIIVVVSKFCFIIINSKANNLKFILSFVFFIYITYNN